MDKRLSVQQQRNSAKEWYANQVLQKKNGVNMKNNTLEQTVERKNEKLSSREASTILSSEKSSSRAKSFLQHSDLDKHKLEKVTTTNYCIKFFSFSCFAIVVIALLYGQVAYSTISGTKPTILKSLVEHLQHHVRQVPFNEYGVMIFYFIQDEYLVLRAKITRIIRAVLSGFRIITLILFCVAFILLLQVGWQYFQYRARIIRRLCKLTKSHIKDTCKTGVYPIVFVKADILDLVQADPLTVLEGPFLNMPHVLRNVQRYLYPAAISKVSVDEEMRENVVATTNSLWSSVEKCVCEDTRFQACHAIYEGKNYRCWRFLGSVGLKD